MEHRNAASRVLEHRQQRAMKNTSLTAVLPLLTSVLPGYRLKVKVYLRRLWKCDKPTLQRSKTSFLFMWFVFDVDTVVISYYVIAWRVISCHAAALTVCVCTLCD